MATANTDAVSDREGYPLDSELAARLQDAADHARAVRYAALSTRYTLVVVDTETGEEREIPHSADVTDAVWGHIEAFDEDLRRAAEDREMYARMTVEGGGQDGRER